APVGPRPDLDGLDDLSTVGIHDDQLPVGARAEEPAVLAVECQAGRFFTRGWRIAIEDLQSPGIKLDDLAGVLQVDEDMPLLIGDSQFGNAPQRQRADSLQLIGVNRRGVVAAVVEGEDPAADRLEMNDVGSSFGPDLAQRLESLRVKSRHARVTAVAGESSVQVGNE